VWEPKSISTRHSLLHQESALTRCSITTLETVDVRPAIGLTSAGTCSIRGGLIASVSTIRLSELPPRDDCFHACLGDTLA